MTQDDLFEHASRPLRLPPASHRNDPDTSHIAERKHAQRRSGNVLIVRDALRKAPGRTAYELAWHCPLSSLEVARRLSDLKSMGLAVHGERRQCDVKGSRCVTWWPASTNLHTQKNE